MNLAKVALYLEYIAFCLRRDDTPRGEPTVKPTTLTNGAEPKAAEKPKGVLTRHPESLAMERVLRAIASLSLTARRRVVGHVHCLLEEEADATRKTDSNV